MQQKRLSNILLLFTVTILELWLQSGEPVQQQPIVRNIPFDVDVGYPQYSYWIELIPLNCRVGLNALRLYHKVYNLMT